MSTRCKVIATVMLVLILVVGCGKTEPAATPVSTAEKTVSPTATSSSLAETQTAPETPVA